MDSGYWKEVTEEEETKRLELLTPYGKLQCKVMPMVVLNVAHMFVEIMMKLQKEWDTLANYNELKMSHQQKIWMVCFCICKYHCSFWNTL